MALFYRQPPQKQDWVKKSKKRIHKQIFTASMGKFVTGLPIKYQKSAAWGKPTSTTEIKD